ncbi:MAG: TRAP transporter large permease [Pseudomonadota bacterium]
MSFSFVWLFILLLASGAPIAFALLAGPGLALVLDGEGGLLVVLASRLFNGIDSYPLMAVPFFILAGEAMAAGGVAASLVRLAKAFLARLRGGLAHVNIAASILFAGMSGSAIADASALGRVLTPTMKEAGYPGPFAAAVTAASSVIGPIIPPSGIMIIYAYVMNVSVAGLFAAGIVPGLLMGVSMMAVTAAIARRRGLPKHPPASRSEQWAAAKGAGPALVTPVILVGGIFSGYFTPTEAAAVAACYALFLAALGPTQLKTAGVATIFVRAAAQSGVVLFLIGASVAFSWMVTVSGLADSIADMLSARPGNLFLMLFALNVLLLIVGMFLDAGPAILILGPALGAAFVNLGVDPLHFAIVMCVNLTVGLSTPPIGLVLFATSSVSGETPERIAIEALPFLAAHLCVIGLITFAPPVALAIPRALGFA